MPLQYTEIFSRVKIENFHYFYIFLVFAQSIDCGYTLSMFRSKHEKNWYTNKFPIYFTNLNILFHQNFPYFYTATVDTRVQDRCRQKFRQTTRLAGGNHKIIYFTSFTKYL